MVPIAPILFFMGGLGSMAMGAPLIVLPAMKWCYRQLRKGLLRTRDFFWGLGRFEHCKGCGEMMDAGREDVHLKCTPGKSPFVSNEDFLVFMAGLLGGKCEISAIDKAARVGITLPLPGQRPSAIKPNQPPQS